ncbi:STAS domain-containing protein [Kitasatospora arboriphila]
MEPHHAHPRSGPPRHRSAFRARPARHRPRGRELDLDSLAPLRKALHRCLSAGISTIDIDTRDITFCDVRGLNLLLIAARRAASAGGILTVRRPSASVARLLDLTDTTDYLIPAPGLPPAAPGHAPSAAAGYAS